MVELRLPKRLSLNPLHSMETDSDIEAIADALISATLEDGDVDDRSLFSEPAAKYLLFACLAYLRDWCRLEQRSFGNLAALIRASIPERGCTVSELDKRFYEIKSGCKRIDTEDGTPARWEVSTLERLDGTRPCNTNGIRPCDDFSLMNYELFRQSESAPCRTFTAQSLLIAMDRLVS